MQTVEVNSSEYSGLVKLSKKIFKKLSMRTEKSTAYRALFKN